MTVLRLPNTPTSNMMAPMNISIQPIGAKMIVKQRRSPKNQVRMPKTTSIMAQSPNRPISPPLQRNGRPFATVACAGKLALQYRNGPSSRVDTPHLRRHAAARHLPIFVRNGLYPAEVDVLFHECGVYFGRRTRHDDGISDERRLAAAPSSLATGFMLGDIGFRREMLLQVVPEEGQDVLPADIHYYDDPPFDDGNYLAHGVDLVISTKESADYTAIVSGEVAWEKEKTQLYVQPNPIIRHMNFTQTMETLDNVRRSTHMSCEVFIE